MAKEKMAEDSEQEEAVPEVTLLLQRAREKRGLSLHETGIATRIPVHYLQLLEGKGDPRLLADAMYLVPFLRTYALFLGIDPAYAVAQFIQLALSKEAAESDLGETPPPSRSYVQAVIVTIVVASLALLLLLWMTRWGLIPWQ
ncbi:MAG: helix-turn-helix domain-containing protein [Candidatus Binatia bacterium]